MDLNYFKTIHLMRDMRRGLDLRQQAIDNGADSETLEKMNAGLHRKFDLLEFVYRKLTIQRPLQSAYLLFSEGQLKEFIEQQRNALKYTGIPCTTFDYYLDLPGYVVREKILSFLNNHRQDLLNLLVAIPTEEKFAPLTKAELEFELVFPKMLYGGEDDEFRYDVEIWEDGEILRIQNQFRAFSMKSDHHRKVILRHFEDFLVNDISNIERTHFLDSSVTCPISVDIVVRSMEGMALQDWIKCPTASKVLMYISSAPVIGFDLEGSQLVGSCIWHAEIGIMRKFGDVLEPLWRKVCRCLGNLANLRNCELYHDFEDENFGDEEEVDPQFGWLAPVQLAEQLAEPPDLQFLKSLNLHAVKFNNADTFRMLRMLLQKYGGQLNQFGFTISKPFDFEENAEFRQFPVDLPPCKNLTLLSFMDKSVCRVYSSHASSHWQSCEMVLRFMSNFREAPLKKIKLSLNDSNSLCTLYRLLSYMGRTFGNTLEHLELDLERWDSYRWAAPPIALLEGVQFPKLVHFATNLHANEQLYKALLRFPVLETLKVGHLWYRTQNEAGWTKQFSENLKGENLNSWKVEIWKELPKLKWIGDCDNWYQEEKMITREEVEGMVDLEDGKEN